MMPSLNGRRRRFCNAETPNSIGALISPAAKRGKWNNSHRDYLRLHP
jgi:hypothetical protein